ncbi:uncharacterized protein B0P05DRAFT_522566 [Gilbertella persicaria]|uniref:uncharacterized protein n=1 Tax=Gilbertella persicaria TaxID=101096 RepID=UPI002220B574|nr:uncharacterized protein B0P05DRAFT_522566 [Gilbertella persicaria]KAI8097909.1 hypothetical protein B0P05DRAFT_522566 [Gilbertella persicaria]
MAPKRKSQAVSTERSKKIAKETTATVERVAKVVIEQRPPVPLSAVAARRAAMNAGLYKPAVVEEEKENNETEEPEEVEEQNIEGIELKSITDEEKEVEEEEEDQVITEPSTPYETPASNSKPLPKLKQTPAFIDYNSVSRFTPTKHNSCIINQEDDTYLFLGLRKEEHVLFMGQVLAAPLFGSISIAGAVLSSGRPIPTHTKEDLHVAFYPVFSPRTHSLLSITSTSLEAPSICPHIYTTELDEFLMEAVFDELKDLHEFESVVVIKNMENSGLDTIRDAIGTFNKNLTQFTKKEYDPKHKSLAVHLLPRFQPILKPTPGMKALKIESSWSERTTMALEEATKRENPVVSVVCGAKDTGKSSYSRYLINRLLSKYKRVAYLEADVGQSEFTPSGLMSLHYISQPILGPPYTHQQLEPERSFFFGSTSPRNNPDYYLSCINTLVDCWRHDQEQVRDQQESAWLPLVVNTQGWVSGVGYHLLLSQIQKVEPTDIFTMRHHMYEYKNLPPSFSVDIMPVSTEAFKVAKEPAVLHYLDCVLQDPNEVTLADNFSSIQQREMTLASYFHQSGMGIEHYLSPQWEFEEHLIERVPWTIDWRQLNAIWVTYEEVKLNELFYALNGSLVGLIGQVENHQHLKGPKRTITTDTFTPPNYLNTQEQPALEPEHTTCHGLGIIRAIDPSRHAILLLTPLPLDTLEKVSSIVKGELQLPLWTMLDRRLEKSSGVANVPWTKVPYITKESTEGAGANALRVRRNLLRRSQA